MPTWSRSLLLFAGVNLALAAMLSAYGFHGLSQHVTPEKMRSWEWAVQMHFYNCLGLIAIAFLLRLAPSSWLLKGAGALIVAGVVLFCGSIYAQLLGAPPAISNVAPMGGTSFMLAWLLTGIAGWRLRATR